ncbi:MAG TPA: hypothetical protein VIJ41_00890 [Candidatus Nanopelagicales bacterium]|jgi:hypothetical protein
MKRRTLDYTLATLGAVMAVVLAIGGGLLLYAAHFTNTTISDQLSAQHIQFPPADQVPAAEYGDTINGYAGQDVTTGAQAKAYSDMIAIHLTKVAGGKTYSQVSDEWIASNADPTKRDAALGAQRQTLFMGETLRGLLLNVYAFSIFGTIALIGGWVALLGALVLAVLAIAGFVHGNNVSKEALIGAPEAESIPAA